MGGQLTDGNGPVDHADVGIIASVEGHGGLIGPVGVASVDHVADGIVVDLIGNVADATVVEPVSHGVATAVMV